MGGNKLKRMTVCLVLAMIAVIPVCAGADNSLSWKNPTVYDDNTSIPLSLQASIETRLYYSYDNKAWTWFATVPNGGTRWTGVLPLAEIVQGFYAITSTIPVKGTESSLSGSIQYPPPIAEEGETFTVSLGSCADTYINTGWKSLDTYSTEPFIRTYTWPARNVANRGFIRWDLSPLPPDISIAGATLGLYYTAEEGGGGDNSYKVSVAKVTGVDPVLDLANWNTYDGVTPWSAGGDGGAANLAVPESSVLVSKTHGWVTWDVTKMVQEWIAAPETNRGMAIDADDSATADSNRFFASRENPDLYPRPQLVVTYKKSPAATVVIDNCTDTYVNLGWYSLDIYSKEPFIGTYTWPARNVANRGFIQWDLSSLPADITVTGATLGLYYAAELSGGGDNAYKVSVAKVTGVDPVLDLANWNTYDGVKPWSGEKDGGAANLAAPESFAIVGKTHDWVTWDITRMVQEWVAAPETNRGMAIDADGSATADSNRFFASREFPDPNLWPKLVITYQSNRQ
ncbi:MAG: DNRLRE domain-containing protein [Deltaproteobacteria bacterium]|nr:DNRLRE domain-containing protein [Candidatus Deferrimicrobiaceae bacterium]